jgi:hypothetical protein
VYAHIYTTVRFLTLENYRTNGDRNVALEFVIFKPYIYIVLTCMLLDEGRAGKVNANYVVVVFPDSVLIELQRSQQSTRLARLLSKVILPH